MLFKHSQGCIFWKISHQIPKIVVVVFIAAMGGSLKFWWKEIIFFGFILHAISFQYKKREHSYINRNVLHIWSLFNQGDNTSY